MSLGSLFNCFFNVKTKRSLSESVSQSVTRSPNELLWTAKDITTAGCLLQFVCLIVLDFWCRLLGAFFGTFLLQFGPLELK